MGAMEAWIQFRIAWKNCYTMQTCNSIASIFGTNEDDVTVDSHTKFYCESEEYLKSYECLFM